MDFTEKIKLLISNNVEVDKKRNIQVQSVSKQEFQRIKRQKLQNKRNEQNRLLWQLNFKRRLKKYNQNIILINKLIQQNINLFQDQCQHPKIKEKINIMLFIKSKIKDLKKFFLFQSDVDEELVTKNIKDNR